MWKFLKKISMGKLFSQENNKYTCSVNEAQDLNCFQASPDPMVPQRKSSLPIIIPHKPKVRINVRNKSESITSSKDSNDCASDDDGIDEYDLEDVFATDEEILNPTIREKGKINGRKPPSLASKPFPIETHRMRRMSPFDIALCRLCNEPIFVTGFECIKVSCNYITSFILVLYYIFFIIN